MNKKIMCAYVIICLILFTFNQINLISTEYAMAQLKSIRNVNEYSVALKKIPYYCLTVGNKERVNHITSGFQGFDLRFVNPPLLQNDDITKAKSGTSGFCKIIDVGLRNQDKFKSFQPFVIMEDDVSQYRPFPETLKIPRDADLVYLGISICSIHDDNVYFERTTIPGIHKVFGMYSMHMILVCSSTGANLITRTNIEDGLNDTNWDMLLADVHPFYNIYALSVPLAYQDESVGGQEGATKWDFPSKKIDLIVDKVPINTKIENEKKNSIAYQASK